MGNENKNVFGAKYTYGVIVRGELSEINKLIEFLKDNNLVVAHSELGQVKLWIAKAGDRHDF